MPMTPFMGVRISWLMLARNSPFARLADSAASFCPSMISLARLNNSAWASNRSCRSTDASRSRENDDRLVDAVRRAASGRGWWRR